MTRGSDAWMRGRLRGAASEIGAEQTHGSLFGHLHSYHI